MDYQVTCVCGKALTVNEGMAGSAAHCPCGRRVAVPSLSALRGEAIAELPLSPASVPADTGENLPSGLSEPAQVASGAHRPSTPALPPAEILPPTSAKLQIDSGISLGRPAQVMAALT